MKTKLIFILLSCFFSSILYAETITVISTPPTIDGVQGTPTENTLTRAKGKVINITAKPKEGFQGVIKIDGVVVSTSEVNSALRYRYTIAKDAKVEISYTLGANELNVLTNSSIKIEGGLMQQVPFNLIPKLDAPASSTVKWFLNDVEITEKKITELGYYQLVAKVIDPDTQDVITYLKTTVAAIESKEVGQVSITPDTNQDSKIYIYESEQNKTALAGTLITIPEGSVSEAVTISAKTVSSYFIPNMKGDALSDVLRLEPSGLIFSKPVIISIPYSQYLDETTVNNISVVRSSRDGSIDYLVPEYIDKENHRVIFKTNHFSDFILNKDFFGKSETEIEIETIRRTFPTEFPKEYSDKKIIEIINYREFKGAPSIYELFSTWDRQKNIVDKLANESYINAYDYLYKDDKHKNIFKTFTLALDSYGKYGVAKEGFQIGRLILAKRWVSAAQNIAGFAAGSVFPVNFAGWYVNSLINISANIIDGYNDIQINKQIETYFALRANHKANDIISALTNNIDIEGTFPTADNKMAFNVNGYTPTKKLTSNFWSQVEFLYVQTKAYNSTGKDSLLELINEVKKQIDAKNNPSTVIYTEANNYPKNKVCAGSNGVDVSFNLKYYGHSISPLLNIKDEAGNSITTSNCSKESDSEWNCQYTHKYPKTFEENKEITYTVEQKGVKNKGNDSYSIKVIAQEKYLVKDINIQYLGYITGYPEDYVYRAKAKINGGYIGGDFSYFDKNKQPITGSDNLILIPKADYFDSKFDEITIKFTPKTDTSVGRCKTADIKERTVKLERDYWSPLSVSHINNVQITESSYLNKPINEDTTILFTFDLLPNAKITGYDIDGNGAFSETSPANTIIDGVTYKFSHSFDTVGKFLPSIKYRINDEEITATVYTVNVISSKDQTVFAPTGLNATAGNTKATITWNSVTDAASYNLYYATFPLISKTNVEQVINVTSPYSLTGLINDTTYYLAVTSKNSSGEESDFSQTVSITTPKKLTQAKLSISTYDITPQTVLTKQALTITTVIENTGNQASEALLLQYKVNNNALTYCADIPILSPSTIKKLSCQITAPTTAGTYTYQICLGSSCSTSKQITVSTPLFRQLTFLSDDFEDGSILSRNTTKKLTWTVKNTGTLALTDVKLTATKTADLLTVSTIEPATIAQWGINETKTFTATINVPADIQAKEHYQRWDLSNNKGKLNYPNAVAGYLDFKFKTEAPKTLLGGLFITSKVITTSQPVQVLLEMTRGNNPFSVFIEWGDGQDKSYDNLIMEDGKLKQTFTHTYSKEGTYNLTVTVADIASESAIYNKTITVNNTLQTTHWQANARNIDTNGLNENMDIKVTEKNGSGVNYGEYFAKWTPVNDANSTEFFTTYSLSVPPNLLALDRKARLIVVTRASAIVAHDRAFSLNTSANKKYTAAIRDSSNPAQGLLQIRNLATKETLDKKSTALTDTAKNTVDTRYEIELTGTHFKAYRYKDSRPNLLESYADNVTADYLTEIEIVFKGDGIIRFASLQYDKNNDGAYGTGETLLLSTVNKQVDWGLFQNSTPPPPPTNTTGKLNDTGITWGGNYPKGNNESCVGEEISAQDCSHGRDAQAAAGTLKKIGAGAAGFDFTKLDANGASLPASASQWSCVKDNHTGLIWEVKTDDEGIHDKDNRYKWGGKTAIGQKATTQFGTYYDDWNSLVDGSNTERLCGYSDWRVPNINELKSIVLYGVSYPTIDTEYFPNTTASGYWSSSPDAGNSYDAWGVNFFYGNDNYNNRNNTDYVRVVRSGQ
ncbi:MAG: DUF1566 domain-containing protein [Methylococcales bacterium]|nr:DUF1566 domain-containing protein [Methylococcales bacterium]